jgi:hypothetical protein
MMEIEQTLRGGRDSAIGLNADEFSRKTRQRLDEAMSLTEVPLNEASCSPQQPESWQQSMTKRVMEGVSKNLHRARSSISGILEIAMSTDHSR